MPIWAKLFILLVFIPIHFLLIWRSHDTHYRYGFKWQRRVRQLGPGVPKWLDLLWLCLYIIMIVVVIWPER